MLNRVVAALALLTSNIISTVITDAIKHPELSVKSPDNMWLCVSHVPSEGCFMSQPL